jgi:(p)ppGpp synthase/HD superfamily hydrolase
MSTEIKRAKEFAQLVHTNHFRRDGVTPYFTHLECVVNNLQIIIHSRKCEFKEFYEDMICAAWLHDSVEDKKTTYDTIKQMFGPTVELFVYHLTHQEDESYEEYIEFAAKTDHTRLIKIADILANLSDSPSKNQVAKYTKALKVLIK